jgi:molecular chaperone IbpA
MRLALERRKIDPHMEVTGRHIGSGHTIAHMRMTMRTVDVSTLYRSTVGFDRLANLLQSIGQIDTAAPAYPPYNIEQFEENQYRVTMAVAGFSESELAIELKEGALTVAGRRTETEPKSKILHQGIAARSFERRFQLAEHMEVQGAKLENGLLHIDILRVIPEEKKARRIAIGIGEQSQPKVIDSSPLRAA